jgi:hypothetical protein
MAKITATTTARQIIEARIGRPLGPIADMPEDLRRAMSALGKALIAPQGGKAKSVRDLMAR